MSPSPHRVALMQPTFLPWQGYFALAASVDTFVFLDDFLFSRRSFHQRNRLFVGQGKVGWVTVPVLHTGNESRDRLDQVKPDLETFTPKFLSLLRHNYGKCAHVSRYDELLRACLAEKHDSLADLNIALIQALCGELGITCTFRRSTTLEAKGARSERLMHLLQQLAADVYVSARGSFGYMKEEGVFPVPGIDVLFEQYETLPYAQAQSPEFVSHLSLLDALMQIGPDETRGLLERGGGRFAGWQEMCAQQDAAPAKDA